MDEYGKSVSKSLLTQNWVQQFEQYEKLWIGFSAGLDSTVLLHNVLAIPELRNKIHAVHVNHHLSTHSTVWQNHCESICLQLNIPIFVSSVHVQSSNVEEHARLLRYGVFESLLEPNHAFLVAQHGDDQAETILLQLLRGAGVDGLAGMPAQKCLGAGILLRPLLKHSRDTLLKYAQENHLTWCEDDKNQDLSFSRNFLRHHILPALKTKWPGVSKSLQRSAMHCQEARTNLRTLANLDYPELTKDHLSVSKLKTFDAERLNNILRVWLQNNQVRLPSSAILKRIPRELLEASQDATPSIQWSDIAIVRYQQTVYLLKNTQTSFNPAPIPWVNFPDPILDGKVQAIRAKQGLWIPDGAHIEIRFRQGGEQLYWKKQTKQLKKLFQEWKLPHWLRDKIPLLFIDNQLAAVVGFAVSDNYYRIDDEDTYEISSTHAIGMGRTNETKT